jgi:hypothetical protein
MPRIIPAGPPPAIQHAPRPLGIWAARGQGHKPLLFAVVPWILVFLSTHNWKLPPYGAGDDGARVCFDELKFIPAVIDHEEAVSRQTGGGIWTVRGSARTS